LLHFAKPISERHTAQHYIGWTPHLYGRIQQHLAGRGARFTQVARERGIPFVIAAAWPGDRNYERRLKNKKHAARLCPICRQARDPQQTVMDLDGRDI
jgi:predicted GIY-YIG superfamily endonuclease